MSDGTSPSSGTSDGIEFVIIPLSELAMLKSTKAVEFTLQDAEIVLDGKESFLKWLDKLKLNLQTDKWLGKARWREDEIDIRIAWLDEVKQSLDQMEGLLKKFRDEEEAKKAQAIKIAKDAVKQ